MIKVIKASEGISPYELLTMVTNFLHTHGFTGVLDLEDESDGVFTLLHLRHFDHSRIDFEDTLELSIDIDGDVSITHYTLNDYAKSTFLMDISNKLKEYIRDYINI